MVRAVQRRVADYASLTNNSNHTHQLLFLSAAERKADVLLEPFDEFASLALLQNCYAIAIAGTHKCVFQRLHERLYASKASLMEREQSLEDRIALAEARLRSIEQHREHRRLSAPVHRTEHR